MQKLRLFKIMEGSTPVYFHDKRLAKIRRDELHDDGKNGVVVVMRGPDHKRGESFNVSKQTKRTHGKKHKRPVSTRG